MSTGRRRACQVGGACPKERWWRVLDVAGGGRCWGALALAGWVWSARGLPYRSRRPRSSRAAPFAPPAGRGDAKGGGVGLRQQAATICRRLRRPSLGLRGPPSARTPRGRMRLPVGSSLYSPSKLVKRPCAAPRNERRERGCQRLPVVNRVAVATMPMLTTMQGPLPLHARERPRDIARTH